MAALGYGEQLIPEELRDSALDFLSSGLQQMERVVKGPGPRMQVSSENGYRKKEFSASSDLLGLQDVQTREYGALSDSESESHAGELKHVGSSNSAQVVGDKAIRRLRESSRQDVMSARSAFVLAALPASAVAFTDTEATQAPFRLISDTVRHVFAGTAARTMAQAFVHPLDTVKTRMQVNKATAPLPLQKWRQHSKEQTIKIFLGRHRILKLRNWLVQGPVDLYRGVTGAVLGTVPVAMVYFATYENCKSALEKRGISPATAHLASASFGAVLSAFIRVPADTLKHRTQAYITPNIFAGARDITAARGLSGLYQGLVPTLLRDVPELTLQFTVYEALRMAIEGHKKVKKLRTWEHLLLGGVSGAVAATATMPLDVAKTALQCGSETNLVHVFQEVVREKGIQGLYSGMGPRVSLIALQGAAFFTLFEAWKGQLKSGNLRVGSDRLFAPKLWRKHRDHIWKRQFVFQ